MTDVLKIPEQVVEPPKPSLDDWTLWTIEHVATYLELPTSKVSEFIGKKGFPAEIRLPVGRGEPRLRWFPADFKGLDLRRVRLMPTKCQLYRHFDADGSLLYVGISLRAIVRLQQHNEGSHWAEKIVQVTIENFPSVEAALAAEIAAIQSEGPLHNIRHVTRK